MKFALLHKLSSFLMVLSAFGALAFGGSLHPVVVATFLGAVVLSWSSEKAAWMAARWVRSAWAVAVVIALLASAVAVVRWGELLTPATYFLLLLVANRLFYRRQPADWLQLYALAFLMLVAAAAQNSELNYGLWFLLFIVSTTWTLTLFHLRREIEENYLLKHREGDLAPRRVEVQRILDSRRIVGPRFLLATSALSVAALAMAVAVFFLFPRVGFGVFFGKSRHSLTLAGFSDGIELGRFGVIQDNPTVVFRVEFPDGRPPQSTGMRWRGMAFDTYDGVRWYRAHHRQRSVPGGRVLRRFPGEGPGPLLRQTIYLEPLDSGVLFGLDRPVAVEPFNGYGAVPPALRNEVRVDDHDNLFHEVVSTLRESRRVGRLADRLVGTPAIRYTVWSRTDPPPRPLLASAPLPDPGRDPDLRPYLTLPPNLTPRVADLARRLAAGKATLLERVEAVAGHLRSHYRYTVDLDRDGSVPPLDDFLFVQRKGHCEYFATAMAILLRVAGVPARVVNGFLGGTWNPEGQYLAVVEGEAHSWVEVFFPGVGWVTFDPTPPGPAEGRRRALGSLDLWLDNLRFRWYKYVIEYDLEKQVGGLYRVYALLRRLRLAALVEPGPDAGGFPLPGRVRAWLPGLKGRALVALVSGVLLGILLLLWRGRSGHHRAGAALEPGRATVLFRRMLAALAAAGLPKGPGETATEYARSLPARGVPLETASAVARAVERYQAVRFSPGPPSPADLLDLQRLVEEARDRLRGGKGGRCSVT